MDTPNRSAESEAIAQAAAEESAPQMDYEHHQRTYERFLHLSKWFVVHMAVLLPALYFFIVGGQPMTGLVFLVIAIGLLVYGIISIPAVARDVARAFGRKGEQS